jgi:hypothetical protein
LITASGFNSLVSFALDQFKSHLGLTNVPQRKRLIITAHSGGGKAVEALLKDLQVDPDEIHLFDATYFGVANLIAWMQHRVRNDASPSPVLDAGALRILYRPGDPKKNTTQKNAQAVQRAITAELATVPGPTVLWSRYRAELTLEPHDTVAQRYGWQLFVDNAATLI